MRYVLCIIFILFNLLILCVADDNIMPLQLTAKADSNILLVTPIEYAKGSADSTRYKITPAQVTLTLTNTGNKVVSINTYCPNAYLLTIDIVGPDNNSIKIIRYLMEMAFFDPKPADFKKLLPGESGTMQVTFPAMLDYMLQQPQKTGLYKVKYTYTALPIDSALDKETIHGSVVSNELTFHVVEASNTDGLLFGIETQTTGIPTDEVLNVIGYVKNSTDKPIIFPAWNYLANNVTITDDTGKEIIPFFAGSDATRKISRDEKFINLTPGKTFAFPMYGIYNCIATDTDTPSGFYNLCQPDGMTYSRKITGEKLRISACINSTKELRDAPEGVWTGKLTAPGITTSINLTAHRRALLERNIDNFSLYFYSNDNSDKPFYSLRLQTAPVSENKLQNDIFAREVQVSNDEAKLVIAQLAKTGMLRDAVSVENAGTAYTGNGYSAKITANTTGKLAWKTDLGWNLAMMKTITSIRTFVNTKAQNDFDLLLGRLSGYGNIWIYETELNKPVSIVTPAGTLIDAYKYINATFKLTKPILPKEADGNKSVPEMNFGNISIIEIQKLLLKVAK